MKNLKWLRVKANLTQEQLGKVANISKLQIGRYERGEAEPKLTTLISLSKTLGVTIDDLIS